MAWPANSFTLHTHTAATITGNASEPAGHSPGGGEGVERVGGLEGGGREWGLCQKKCVVMSSISDKIAFGIFLLNESSP